MAVTQVHDATVDDRSLAVASVTRAFADLPIEAVHRIMDYVEAWHRMAAADHRAETYVTMLATAFEAVREHHDATTQPTSADIQLWYAILSPDSIRSVAAAHGPRTQPSQPHPPIAL